MMGSAWRHLLRLAGLVVVSFIALQVYFLLRVAMMSIVDPQSTSFQRSEAWRLLRDHHQLAWSQQWVAYERLSPQLKRAVIASEDAGFSEHSGVEWDAIERAWEKNVRAEARVEKLNQQLAQREARRPSAATAKPRIEPKIVGGSTITQQLAKNLFLDSERSLMRKVQEFLVTFMLEGLLNKQRILEIYLNNVEWGEGLFGAQAASHHYFHVDAAQLGAFQAARLAVMLPAPKRFEKRADSPYIYGRASVIAVRMPAVELP